MTEWYGEDLAYIHDAGHADFALRPALGILEILSHSGIHAGLVVDLGCRTGLWARELIDAGYDVLGIDISEAMVEIARQRVPEAEFRVGSLFEAELRRIPSSESARSVHRAQAGVKGAVAGGYRPTPGPSGGAVERDVGRNSGWKRGG